MLPRSTRRGEGVSAAAPLRLHAFEPTSCANGPGLRAVVWMQGCTLACPGCFNPQTHARAGGFEISVAELFARLAALGNTVEGVTFTGGEPLQQRREVLPLLRRIRRETPLSVLLFTGYRIDEVQALPDSELLLDCVDVLIAGRYVPSRRLGAGLLGSANQTIHFLTNRYAAPDLEDVAPAELIITREGNLVATGVDPVVL